MIWEKYHHLPAITERSKTNGRNPITRMIDKEKLQCSLSKKTTTNKRYNNKNLISNLTTLKKRDLNVVEVRSFVRLSVCP